MRAANPFSARFAGLLALIWGILVWSNWLIVNPVSFNQLRAALRAFGRVDWVGALPSIAGHALSAAGLIFLALAAMGVGKPVLLFLHERRKSGRSLTGCALGAGVLSMCILGLGFVGLAFPITAWALAGAGAFGGVLCVASAKGFRPGSWRIDPAWRSTAPIWLSAGLALAVLIALFGSLAPARAYDEIFHHLAHPRIFADLNKVIGLPHHFLSHYPALLEMQYLLAMLLGGGLDFAKLVHFLWGLFVLALLFRWLRESLSLAWALAAAMGFMLLPYVQLVITWGYVDLGTAGYLTLALMLASGRRAGLATLGLICGFCAGTKPGGIFAGVLVVILLVSQGRVGKGITAYFLALIAAAIPWALRNWFLSGNPLAPFLSGLIPTLNFGPENMARYYAELVGYADDPGIPGSLLPLLAQPWNSSIRNLGVLDAGGGMGGWFIFALPCLLIFPSRGARLPALLCGAYFLLWLAIPRQVRYLLPIWPAATVAVAHIIRGMAGREGLPRLVAFTAGVILFLQLPGALQRQHFASDPLRVAFGTESPENYLARGIGGRPYSVWAMQWLRGSLPQERVMIIDYGLGILWGPKAIFQSAFDTPLIERFARESVDAKDIAKKFRQLKIRRFLYETVGGFPMQNEYRIFNFDRESGSRWRSYWQSCARPIYNQNDRYIIYALQCSGTGRSSTLPGIDEQILARINVKTRWLAKQGRLQEAMPDLTLEYRKIASEWESPQAFEQLGWTWFDMKNPIGAREALNKAERMGRDSATLHLLLGMLNQGAGDFAGAISRYERCLELDPAMGECRIKLAEALIHLGRREQAHEVMKLAPNHNPIRP